ncbi:RDD family protein [Microbacterium sp. JZ37]|nr:RDD family protein [Microbacterium sp. JZ37]
MHAQGQSPQTWFPRTKDGFTVNGTKDAEMVHSARGSVKDRENTMKVLWWRRAGDFLVGTLIPWSLLSQLLGTVFFRRSWPGGWGGALVATLAFAAIVVIGSALSKDGQTPSQRLCGLRVLTLDDRVAGRGRQAARAAGHLLDMLSLGVGFLWPLWDSRAQSFADKLAATVVVRAGTKNH